MLFDPRHKHLALLRPEPAADTDPKGQIAVGALALSYGDGWGAFTKWLPLAHQGDLEAMFLAGTLLASGGNGVTPDLAGAYQLLHAAAAAGHAKAAFNAALVALRRQPLAEGSAVELPTVVALLRLSAQGSDDTQIHDRVHRLAGALSRELPDGGTASVRSAMNRITTAVAVEPPLREALP